MIDYQNGGHEMDINDNMTSQERGIYSQHCMHGILWVDFPNCVAQKYKYRLIVIIQHYVTIYKLL